MTDSEKAAALTAQARERALKLTPESIDYLMRHAPRDMRSLSALIVALDRYTLEHIVEERTIGPSLGAENIERGFKSTGGTTMDEVKDAPNAQKPPDYYANLASDCNFRTGTVKILTPFTTASPILNGRKATSRF